MDEPQLHLWDSGVIRITRHPQALGQLLWCLAHTLWIGNSFMVVTSGALMAHHAFGCWHGDSRLRRKWGKVRPSLTHPQQLTTYQLCLHLVNAKTIGGQSDRIAACTSRVQPGENMFVMSHVACAGL